MHKQATITTYRKATFWRRFFAFLMDSIFLWALEFLITWLFILNYAVAFHLNSILFYSYNIFMDYYFQGTLGKKVLGLRVISIQRKKPGFINVFYRNFGKIISSIPVMQGFVQILAPHRHQTIHDELGRCFVIEVVNEKTVN
jgi:uncharacterized RDD family membrane protein YckC